MSNETIQDETVGSSSTTPPTATVAESGGNTDESQTETVALIDILPNSPLNERTWDTIGSLDWVVNQRPVYPMNDEGLPPRKDDDLGSFLLEIDGVGWRGYHYVPEDSEWMITFTGKDYNMILDMHEEYVLPHMEQLMELRQEFEDKKAELLENKDSAESDSDETASDNASDSGNEDEEPTESSDPDEDSQINTDEDSDADGEADVDADTDSAAQSDVDDRNTDGVDEDSDSAEPESGAVTPPEGS